MALAFRSDNANAQGDSRFSLVFFQQNDHYLYNNNFEPAQVALRFRGMVAKFTVDPGLYT